MSTPPPFGSALGPVIASYLALKKALGRRFRTETAVLLHLDRFLVAQRPAPSALTPNRFAAWSITLAYLTPTVRRNRMRIVRNLCLYLRRTDPACFVPDPSGFPAPHPPKRPHIFTEEQIVRLLRVATDLAPASTSPLRAEVYRLAIVLLYTVGVRRGELVRLVLSDYDVAERTLLVRASKFHKSRLVALSQDGAREMDRYLRARSRLWHDADAPLLVTSHGGLRAYTGASIRNGLCAIFHAADVRTATGRLPRVHDLRHSYAVHAASLVPRRGRRPGEAAGPRDRDGPRLRRIDGVLPRLVEPVAEAASLRFARHCRDVLADVSGTGGDQ